MYAFIELTQEEGGLPVYVRADAVTGIGTEENLGSLVCVVGTNRLLVVTEPPEEIISLVHRALLGPVLADDPES
jgi:hypothetical protein